jgi:hypothetical protein
MCLPAARQISIGLRTQRDPSGGVGVSLSHQALRLLENWSHTKTVVPDEAKRVARGGADATRRLVAVIVRGRSTGLSGHRLPATVRSPCDRPLGGAQRHDPGGRAQVEAARAALAQAE